MLHFAMMACSNLRNSITELLHMALITHNCSVQNKSCTGYVCQMCILPPSPNPCAVRQSRSNFVHIPRNHAESKTVTIGMIRLMIKYNYYTISKHRKIISRLTYTVCSQMYASAHLFKRGSHVTITRDAFDPNR